MSGGAEKAAEPEAPSGARVGDGAPQKSASAWGDLSQRVVSGVVLGAAAAFAVSQGGYWTMGLAAVAALVRGWEFRRILAARQGGWRAVDWYFPLLAALTPVAMTVHPASTNVFATPRPIPRVPPVTKACRS